MDAVVEIRCRRRRRTVSHNVSRLRIMSRDFYRSIDGWIVGEQTEHAIHDVLTLTYGLFL